LEHKNHQQTRSSLSHQGHRLIHAADHLSSAKRET
jgi:hypothetical protein